MTKDSLRIKQNSFKILKSLDGEDLGTILDSLYLSLKSVIETTEDPSSVYLVIQRDIQNKIDRLIKEQTTH